jgi:hypothetical protein
VAASSSSEDNEEKNNVPAAYNANIYLMVGMPYLLFAVVGILIYRGVKKNADYLKARDQSGDGSEPR